MDNNHSPLENGERHLATNIQDRHDGRIHMAEDSGMEYQDETVGGTSPKGVKRNAKGGSEELEIDRRHKKRNRTDKKGTSNEHVIISE